MTQETTPTQGLSKQSILPLNSCESCVSNLKSSYLMRYSVLYNSRVSPTLYYGPSYYGNTQTYNILPGACVSIDITSKYQNSFCSIKFKSSDNILYFHSQHQIKKVFGFTYQAMHQISRALRSEEHTSELQSL